MNTELNEPKKKIVVIYRIHILVLFLLLFYYTVHPAPAEMSELTKAVLAAATGNRRPNNVEGKSCLSVCLTPRHTSMLGKGVLLWVELLQSMAAFISWDNMAQEFYKAALLYQVNKNTTVNIACQWLTLV